MIDIATLEAWKGEALDEHEIRFQKHLRMVSHRPHGVPRTKHVLQCFAAVITPIDKLLSPIPEANGEALMGQGNGSGLTLNDILMTSKVLENDEVAFPLIACEAIGEQKTRVRVVKAIDVAAWMPSLGAIAGITDDDLLTYEDYELIV